MAQEKEGSSSSRPDDPGKIVSGPRVSRRRRGADLRGLLRARVDCQALRDVVRHLQPLRAARRPHVLLRPHLGRGRLTKLIQ